MQCEAGLGLPRVIRVGYERSVLRSLEPVGLRKGEEVRVRIEKDLRERLKDLIGVFDESSDEELEKHLGGLATVIFVDKSLISHYRRIGVHGNYVEGSRSCHVVERIENPP